MMAISRNPVTIAAVGILVAFGVALFLVCGVLSMRRAMPAPDGVTAHEAAIAAMNSEIEAGRR